MSHGDVEEFGKKIGGDILCNKKTYLLIKAFELASEEDKALLKEWVVKGKFESSGKDQGSDRNIQSFGSKRGPEG